MVVVIKGEVIVIDDMELIRKIAKAQIEYIERNKKQGDTSFLDCLVSETFFTVSQLKVN